MGDVMRRSWRIEARDVAGDDSRLAGRRIASRCWRRLVPPPFALSLALATTMEPDRLAAATAPTGGATSAVWPGARPAATLTEENEAFLEELQRASFRFFDEQIHPRTGLARDRARADGSPSEGMASIGSSGFALAAWVIAVQRARLYSRGGSAVDDTGARATSRTRIGRNRIDCHRRTQTASARPDAHLRFHQNEDGIGELGPLRLEP
jgi:hypothetical protein